MGDQPIAIDELTAAVKRRDPAQVLLGITGSGKTFTMANVVERIGRPTLVMAHNKTLAHQLFLEFRELFPDNAIHYFVSYYDTTSRRPTFPSTDTYIEKDRSSTRDRSHAPRATYALLTRRDALIVASVSCIYGIGAAGLPGHEDRIWPSGSRFDATPSRRLVEIHYERTRRRFLPRDVSAAGRRRRDLFRLRTREGHPCRMVGGRDRIHRRGRSLRGKACERSTRFRSFPDHHKQPARELVRARDTIRIELRERLAELKAAKKLVEEQRLQSAPLRPGDAGADGSLQGHRELLTPSVGARAGERPHVARLLPQGLPVVSKNHTAVPQVGRCGRAIARGRKPWWTSGSAPSALDKPTPAAVTNGGAGAANIFVSANTRRVRAAAAGGVLVEQIIRPPASWTRHRGPSRRLTGRRLSR